MSLLSTTRKSLSENKKEGNAEINSVGVRRTKSLDAAEIENEQPPRSGLQRRESFVGCSKPFATQGLKRVDSILIDDLWSDSSTVVMTALRELYSLCRDEGSDAVESLHSGGASTIVGVARKFHNTVGIQREALRVLAACLKQASEDFCLQLTRLGGLRIVASVMEKFIDDETMQELASEVLRAMVSTKTSKVPSEVFITQNGGLPLLLRSLKAHQSNATITQQLTLAFCGMARFGSLRKDLEVGIDTVRKFLPADSAVVKARTESPNNVTALGA